MQFQNTAELIASIAERTKPYRVAEVAELVDVHPVTIYRDIKAGNLRALRVGRGTGALRVLPQDFAAYLVQREVQPVSADELAEVAA